MRVLWYTDWLCGMCCEVQPSPMTYSNVYIIIIINININIVIIIIIIINIVC